MELAQPEAAPSDVTIDDTGTIAPPSPEPQVEPNAYDPASFYKDDKPRNVDAPPEQDPAPEQDPKPEGEDPEPEPEPEPSPIEPPTSWAKDAKEVFAKLPPEAQEIIATREKERDKFLLAKGAEAAQTRQAVETEAYSVIREINAAHVQNLQQYSALFNPDPPDERLLTSQDPGHYELYKEQVRIYQLAAVHRNNLAEQSNQARAAAEAAQKQINDAQDQREIDLLNEKLGPEWSDPSARTKMLEAASTVAQELGYSAEDWQHARASDILALRTASEWRTKAAKYDQLMKTKMEPVRAAKLIPPSARAGAPGQHQAPPIQNVLYPNDVRRT